MHSYRNILPDLRKLPKYAHVISKIDEIFDLIKKGEKVNHIVTETKSTINQKEVIIELKAENKLLKLQLDSANTQLEAYKSRSSLIHLLERVPEHQIDAVGLRLDAMVKMLA
jgi:fibrillarin-like rRNA methylase